jgi:UDP-N-acetyl-D-mannosaminuronic acid dehydrogenase
MEKICVLGLGYVGLPTASLLATKGYSVAGVDVKQDVVDQINRGKVHIVEPDLDVMVKSAVQSGNLKAYAEAQPADIFIIATPTPFKGDHQPDLRYVFSAARGIAKVAKEGDLIILESTSPVGTTEQVRDIILKECPGLNGLHVCHCPERVLPGRVLHELIDNDRVIGGVDEQSTDRAVDFYQHFVQGELLETNARTAELAKLVENTSRDVNIAFANELSVICEKLNIDVWELIDLANRHPRVNILRPGPGVGGHCIAVDPWFIVSSVPEASRLVKLARQVNDSKPTWVLERVVDRAKRFKNPIIGCLGLAYKPDIDDLRESPAMLIAKQLTDKGVGKVMVCEPNVTEVEGLDLQPLETILEKADILVALVAHKQFKRIHTNKLEEKIVFDTCGVWR